MSKTISYGYLIPHSESIEVAELTYYIGNQVIEHGSEEVPNWDFETNVRAICRLNVDLDRFCSSSGFPPPPAGQSDRRFSAHLTFHSTKTKQRIAGPRVSLHNGQITLKVESLGELLGGILQTTISIALAQDILPGESSPVSAKTAGSRLWTSDVYSLALEGVGAQLTITTKDFEALNIEPRKAMWLIKIDRDLNLPIESGLRVYLNSSNSQTLEMLEKPNSPKAKVWNQWLEADIHNQLLLNALFVHGKDELDDDFDEGSLGEALQNLVRNDFPHYTDQFPTTDPSLLAAVAQAETLKASS